MTASPNFLYPNEPSKFSARDTEPLLIHCMKIGASDITIKTNEQVFCEIHGKQIRVTTRRLTTPELIEIIGFLYGNEGAIAQLNASQPIDDDFEIKPDRGTRFRYRVNMTAISSHGRTGYELTLRTIPGEPPLISTMNLPKEIMDNLCPKQGMILITGATGSGKSTLLASIIRMLCEDVDGNRKILTYESPIEFVYDDIVKPSSILSQSSIPKHIKNFAEAIRNALRRKPSVILVGEMRDKETISEGVTASMTGHLVYSTLHSNGVAEAIRRMVNSFNEEEKNARAVDIITSTKMIVSQMLLPSTDGRRVAIREYLVFNEEIMDLLLTAGTDNITQTSREVLKKFGHTFLQDAKEKFDAGLIDKFNFSKIQALSKGSDRDAGL